MSGGIEYGVRYYGRGPFDVWYDSITEAEHERDHSDDKHRPAILIARRVGETAWLGSPVPSSMETLEDAWRFILDSDE